MFQKIVFSAVRAIWLYIIKTGENRQRRVILLSVRYNNNSTILANLLYLTSAHNNNMCSAAP